MPAIHRSLALSVAFTLALPTVAGFAAEAETAAEAADAAGAAAWQAPDCRRITGAPSISATVDRGATLAATKGRMAPVSYSFGLVTLDRPDTLLATVNSKIIRSTDAGCTWVPQIDLAAQTGGALLTLTKGPSDRAYAWALNDSHFSTIFRDFASTQILPGGTVLGLGVDAGDPLELRYGDSNGTVWETLDGGTSWFDVGGLDGVGVYRFAFDPRRLQHIVLGSIAQGAWVSFDAGQSWQKASGLSASGGPVNVFNLVVSPVDSNVVWAMGLDIAEADAGAPSGGRHIYASSDGGLSYRKVVDQDERITLINGPLLVPAPNDAGVLYFVFGSSFANYGTDLYRYDATTKQVTLTHNAYDNIGAIAFHPRNARLMYLGLVSQDVAD